MWIVKSFGELYGSPSIFVPISNSPHENTIPEAAAKTLTAIMHNGINVLGCSSAIHI